MVEPVVLATVPWSDEPPGLPRRLEPEPRSGWALTDEVRLVPAPVRVRRDQSGELWAGNGAQWIVHCGGSGALAAPDGAGPLLDFAVVDDRAYGLLERVDGGTRLRWYGPTGLRWQCDGDFGKVLTGGEHVYTVQRHGPAVYEWDTGTGDLIRTLDRSSDAGTPFMVDGLLCAVFTDFAAGQRGIEQLSPDGSVSRTALAGAEQYAWLVNPIGFDVSHRVYAVRGGEVARITPTGRIESLGSVGTGVPPDLLEVDPDGRVVYARATDDGVAILRL